MVDEFQDVNCLDLLLMKAIATLNKSELTIIGDDWRTAAIPELDYRRDRRCGGGAGGDGEGGQARGEVAAGRRVGRRRGVSGRETKPPLRRSPWRRPYQEQLNRRGADADRKEGLSVGAGPSKQSRRSEEPDLRTPSARIMEASKVCCEPKTEPLPHAGEVAACAFAITRRSRRAKATPSASASMT